MPKHPSRLKRTAKPEPEPRASTAPALLTIFVADEVVFLTRRLLLSYSKPHQFNEGIVYWAGKRSAKEVFIATASTPRAKTTPGSFHVSAVENARVIAAVNDVELELVAQVHSHPFRSHTEHSPGDDKMAFMPYEGFISIVVNDYAVDGLLPLTDCGVHVFRGGRFVRLSARQVQESFRILPAHVELRNDDR